MKRILYIIALIAPLFLTSCHKKIWDKLNDHEARIARLEALCNQMNSNITSLQTIVNVLQSRDWVKDIVPVMENGSIIGYTLTFGFANPVTVYNGKDAKAPVISIRQADDGFWYWTLDGEWLTDGAGNKIRAEASAPRLKIEDDFWWASYDNGSTWENLGKATTSGGGDSIIKNLYWDEKFVYIVLNDDQEIKINRNQGLSWEYVD